VTDPTNNTQLRRELAEEGELLRDFIHAILHAELPRELMEIRLFARADVTDV